MKNSDRMLIKWLLTESHETIHAISAKTEVDQNTLNEIRQDPSKISELDKEISDELLAYAKRAGAEA